jgi:membrane-bound lytic murein transglycosylase D
MKACILLNARGPWRAWVLGAALGCASCAVCAGAQDRGVWVDLLDAAHESLNEALKSATGGEYELAFEPATPAEFRELLAGFQAALETGDLSALAAWAPAGHDLIDTLDAVPAMRPYADWLRQRLDYADVAREAERAYPAPPPPTPIPAESTRPTRTPPPPPPPPPPLPEAITRQRDQRVQDPGIWARKATSHPVPQRAESLVPRLKEIFHGHGIPPELVWMAEVESTFNPQARSPVGAAGLFQLMPATARHLGLDLEPDDQRFDPDKNADAAARYLKYLHGRFDDWPLAIAAYNGGEGRVGGLLRQRRASNFDAIASALPAETRMYVPKVLATIRVREPGDPTAAW